jgi:hypothetical protein
MARAALTRQAVHAAVMGAELAISQGRSRHDRTLGRSARATGRRSCLQSSLSGYHNSKRPMRSETNERLARARQNLD